MIIRKPDQRYCPSCIQETRESNEVDKKKLHARAAAGWGFKSKLLFYKVPSNLNGKMTMKAYEEMVLNGPFKEWLDRGDDFILEEDRD